MASIISAGTSTGTALNLTGDTSGALSLASNNGTVGLTMDTSQNVGIGTASPVFKVQVTAPVVNAGVSVGQLITNAGTGNAGSAIGLGYNTGNGYYAQVAGLYDGTGSAFTVSTSALGVAASERMRIDSSGRVLIASTLAANGNFLVNNGTNKNVQIRGGIRLGGSSIQSIQSDLSTDSPLEIFCNTAQLNLEGTPITFITGGGGVERMRIDSSGSLLLGQTTGSSKFNLTTVSGGSAITITDGTASGLAWQMGPRVGTGTLTDFGFYNATGSVFLGRMTSAGVWYQGNNSGSWSITSDERIKENINTLNNGLSIITALRPVEFDYKISKKHDIGFIAQEYQKILPEQINENEPTNETKEFIDDGKLLGISSNLVPYLVSAIQELNAKVDAQAAEIQALKGAK